MTKITATEIAIKLDNVEAVEVSNKTEAREVVRAYIHAKEAEKACKDLGKKLKTALEEYALDRGMGHMERIGSETEFVRYYVPTDTLEFDKERFKAEHPEVYAEYCTKVKHTEPYIKK